MAGAIGVDPKTLTLRQLFWMAEGRAKDQWQHTSSLLALIANVNRDPKKTQEFKPSDFNPTLSTSRPDVIVVDKENVSLLKKMFTGDPK